MSLKIASSLSLLIIRIIIINITTYHHHLEHCYLQSGSEGLQTSDVTTQPKYPQDSHYPENLIMMYVLDERYTDGDNNKTRSNSNCFSILTCAILRISSSYSPLLFMLLKLKVTSLSISHPHLNSHNNPNPHLNLNFSSSFKCYLSEI